MNCPKCNLHIYERVDHCPTCGAAQDSSTRKITSRQLGFAILGAVLFYVILSALWPRSSEPPTPPLPSSPVIHEPSRAASATPSISTIKPQPSDLDEYIKFIRKIDKKGDVIVRIELGPTPDYVKLTVSSSWHYEPYQMRLQSAQMSWKAWAGIHSPNEPDKARIKIVDLAGNEVGGSRLLGGSLIWVQDK